MSIKKEIVLALMSSTIILPCWAMQKKEARPGVDIILGTEKLERKIDRGALAEIWQKALHAACQTAASVWAGKDQAGAIALLDSDDLANQCHLNATLVHTALNNPELLGATHLKEDVATILKNAQTTQPGKNIRLSLLENIQNQQSKQVLTFLALNLLRPHNVLHQHNDAVEQWSKLMNLCQSAGKMMENQIHNKRELHNNLCSCIRRNITSIRLGLLQNLVCKVKPTCILKHDCNNLEKSCFCNTKNQCILPKMIGMDILLGLLKPLNIDMVLRCKTKDPQHPLLLGVIHPEKQGLSIKHLTSLDEIPLDQRTKTCITIAGRTDEKSLPTENIDPLLRSIASVWMNKYQPEGEEKIASLGLEKEHAQLLEKGRSTLGLSYNGATKNFVIEHMHPDTMEHALRQEKQ